MAQLQDGIEAIEACETVPALTECLHRIVQDYGFAAFGFVDISDPTDLKPFWVASSSQSWNDDYQGNGFLADDPVVSRARRSNVAFAWSDLRLPTRSGRHRPAALRIIEAASDHGFVEGLAVPFHFVDKIGRRGSASCVLYWSDKRPLFGKISRSTKAELHTIMIYWVQRVLAIIERTGSAASGDTGAGETLLTDRERHVLTWVGRGKTNPEIATILSISTETAEWYVRQALRKLDSHTKTQAVVIALTRGLIDV